MVQPGATLFMEDLKKNGIESPEALYSVIYSGKGKMPGYGLDCKPRVCTRCLPFSTKKYDAYQPL